MKNLEYENYFKDKLITFYIEKRKKGDSCEVATVKAFQKISDIGFLSLSRMDSSIKSTDILVQEAIQISQAILNIKKDKRTTQRMEDAFAFSKIKTLKTEHLKLLM